MPRYLLFFSYVGTRFSGIQVQPNTFTVQGILESVLSSVVKSKGQSNAVRLRISSRTDTGVHALMNTAVVDLPPTASFANSADVLCVDNPALIVARANFVFWRINIPVRLTGCRIVSDGFCPRRHALLRHYLYRLAVLKPGYSDLCESHGEMTAFPISEHNRCWFLSRNFDPYKFRQAGSMFIGTHNFAGFMNIKSESVQFLTTERRILHVGVDVGAPLMDTRYDPSSECYTFYDISIVAKSFLYKQIRRMVSCMVRVAQNQMKPDDIRWLFEHPQPASWNAFRVSIAPAHGLYLKLIEYDSEDFDNPRPYYKSVDDTEKEEASSSGDGSKGAEASDESSESNG